MIRKIVLLGCVAASVILLAVLADRASSSAQQKPKTNFPGVTLVGYTWGGAWNDGLQEAFCKPLAAETGVACRYVAGSSVGNVSKVIAEKNDPQADFLLVDDALIPELVENKAIDKLDFSRISNTAGYFGSIQKQIKQYENYYLPVVTQSVGIGYRQDLLKKAGLPVPTRWSDLWNPIYKGRVVLLAWNYNFGWSFIEAVAAVRCGDPKNLECAFQEVKKLRETGQLALTVDSLVALQKAYADGEAWLGLCSNNTCFTAQDKGVDVQFFVPQDYPLTTTSGVAAVRRTNWDALMALFNMCADARGQAKLLESVTQGPVHKDARQYLPPKMLARVPTTEAQWSTLITPNWDHMRKYRPAFMERFTREVAR